MALEQTPIPNKTLNPAIPDADKLTLNAGVGSSGINFLSIWVIWPSFIKNEKGNQRRIGRPAGNGSAFLCRRAG